MGLYMYGYGWVERRLFMHVESYSGAIGSNLRAYWQQKYENQGGISPAFFC